jgi:hypothetical protein
VGTPGSLAAYDHYAFALADQEAAGQQLTSLSRAARHAAGIFASGDTARALSPGDIALVDDTPGGSDLLFAYGLALSEVRAAAQRVELAALALPQMAGVADTHDI